MSVPSTPESLGALLGDSLRRTLVLALVLDDVQLRDLTRQAGEPSVVACADEPRLSQ